MPQLHVHVTYSSVVLLYLGVLDSTIVVALLLTARRLRRVSTASPRVPRWPLTAVLLSPLPLLWLAREHLPLVGLLPGFPPPRFCFGPPDTRHLVSFLMPLVAGLAAIALSARVPAR